MQIRLLVLAGAIGLAPCLAAQPSQLTFIISTVAGSNTLGDGGPAAAAALSDAQGVAMDQAGNVFVADASDQRIRKVGVNGIITTIAGDGTAGSDGDGGPAKQAQFRNPYGVVVDQAGNLYVADLGNNRIRRITPDGIVETLLPDVPGPWLAPRNMALDPAGNIYVAEFEGHRIRKISSSGVISIFAGTGAPGFSGDTGPARDAQFAYPAGLAFDALGNLYVADSANHCIRKIASYGVITTVLGTGVPGASDPAQLNLPTGVAISATGDLYVADSGNQRIRRLAANGTITTVPGEGRDLAFDSADNLYMAAGARLLELTAAGDLITVIGDAAFSFAGDGGAATTARLNGPAGVAVNIAGELFIADSGNHRVRKVDAGGIIRTVTGDGTPGLDPGQLNFPQGLSLDGTGNLYIADQNNDRVQELAPSGLPLIAAGTGAPGFNGDGFPGATTQFFSPSAVAVSDNGTLVVADTGNRRVRAISPGGTTRTVASDVAARGVAVDSTGNVYVADTLNHRVLSIDSQGGVQVVAGTGVADFSGDGAPAAAAQLNQPTGLAFDTQGNLFVADTGNQRVRYISPQGIIQTVAGTGAAGSGGDGGPAAAAQLNAPAGLAVDAQGTVWIADAGNHRVRKLTPAAPPAEELPPPAIVNAASGLPGAVAPGEIVSIFGVGLGPAIGALGALDSAGSVATELADVEVRFDGQAAPLFYVQDTQINAQVPYAVVGTTVVEVIYRGVAAGKTSLPAAAASPAIFCVSGGTGPAAALNAIGTLNSAANPASRGSVITIYATGEGQTVPQGKEGQPATAPFPAPALPVSVTVGGFPADILFAGEAPGFAGLLQINARLPAFMPSGILDLVLSVGDFTSQPGVTLAVR